jgi:large subunit ribosomal protein L1|tara:strand:+ start:241 stop:915 length:675 start_codon:yes stop_codon:yes gene_type:complete
MSKGKYLTDLYKSIDNKLFNVEEAVKLIVEKKRKNFDETIEISMNLGVDPRHADQMVRGVVSLPNGNGKVMKIAVFAKEKKAEEAKQAGADIVGADDLAKDMQNGNLDYDRVIATPDLMGVVGRIGKILGPKGLMPNPKLGTVTLDIKSAVEAAKSGQVQYRAEKTGIVQAGIGKASFGPDKLIENVNSFVEAIQKSRPSGAKGTFIKKISISSTMGVGINVNI